MIDEQPAEEPGAGTNPGAEAGIAADSTKDRTRAGTGGAVPVNARCWVGVMSAQATSDNASAQSKTAVFMRFLPLEPLQRDVAHG